MRSYEFKKHMEKSFSEPEIRKHIQNIKRFEEIIGRSADDVAKNNDVLEDALKGLWKKVLPWKIAEMKTSVNHYATFYKATADKRPKGPKKRKNTRRCPACDAELIRGAVYCENCGVQVGKSKNMSMNRMRETFDSIPTVLKGVLAVVLVALMGMSGVTAVNKISERTVPLLTDMHLSDAMEEVEYSNIDRDNVILVTEDNQTITYPSKIDYYVIEQNPEEDTVIDKNESVTLTCKPFIDMQKEALSDARLIPVEDAIDVAEDFECEYKLIAADGSSFNKAYEAMESVDRDKYYVESVNVDALAKGEVEFRVDRDVNIVKKITDGYATLVGQNLSMLKNYDNPWPIDLFLKDYDKETIYIDDITSSEYQIVSIGTVSLDNRTVAINADKIEHIKFLDSLKSKVPYEGLAKKYLNLTAAGKYTTKEKAGKGATRYIWKSTDGKYNVLEVVTRNKKVDYVEKKHPEVYWTGALPNFNADKDAYDKRAEEERQRAEEARRAAEAAAAARAQQQSSSSSGVSSSSGGDATVYVTNTGKKYHTYGCHYLKSIKATMSQSQAKANGYTPCSACAW